MLLYYLVTLLIQAGILVGDFEFHKLENISKVWVIVVAVLFCWAIVPYLIGKAIVKTA